MKTTTLLFSLILFNLSFGQTWADDVATIVYNKCSKCHNSGGVAPFPIVTYNEASSSASAILAAINSDEMPPWPPDNNYQQYVHDRSLTPTEKTTMVDWINNGAIEGNPANTPPPPVFTTGPIYGSGDLEVQIPTYMSKATAGNDDYVCFALPSNLPTDRVVKAIEIVPGNKNIVHHALVYIDPNSGSVTDTVGGDCGGPSGSSATLVMGYTPGGSPMVLPSTAPLKLGMTIPANSQVVFAMHYPDGSYGEYDSTKVIFHFYPLGETGVREVSAAPVLQNWGFVLPPEQITNVSAQFPPVGGITADFSVLSVFPHMHLLGQTMEVYGITPATDTIKFIKIPEWDFHWQDFYIFKNMVKAESGTVIKADGIFDNTSANPHNPNVPPDTVYAGLNTTDEMFLTYFHYLDYVPGDELYDMDSLMNLSSAGLTEVEQGDASIEIYPNPFDDQINIHKSGLHTGDQVSVTIYDNRGELIKVLLDKETVSNETIHIEWNGTNDEGATVSPGVYHVSMNVNGLFTHKRIIKTR